MSPTRVRRPGRGQSWSRRAWRASYAGRQAAATAASARSRCDVARPPRLEAGRAPTRRRTSTAPTRRRCSRGPAGQCSIRSVNVDAEPVAQPAQVGLGVAQEVAGVDHRRRPRGQRVEQPHLLEQADVLGLAGLARADVRRHHLGRVADQQHVAEVARPSARSASSAEVVGHVLGVLDVGASGSGARSRAPPRPGRSAGRRSPRRGRGGRSRSAARYAA